MKQLGFFSTLQSTIWISLMGFGLALALSGPLTLKSTTKNITVPVNADVQDIAGKTTVWSFTFPQVASKTSNTTLKTLNALLRQDSGADTTKPDGSMSLDNGYQVVYNQKQLLSVLFHNETYGFGAAHPNHAFVVKHYDVANAKRMPLSSFFKANYTALATKYINAHKPSCSLSEGAIELSLEGYLTPKGLTLIYDPYAICSYADGMISMEIPKAVLMPAAGKWAKQAWK